MPALIEDLMRLVKIPSIAFPGFPSEPVTEMANATAELFRGCGADSVELLDVPGGPQAVFARFAGPTDAPTVLLYAHYDVQPAPMEQGWDTDPFTPVIKDDGRIYGRGAADNKSGIAIHVGTLRVLGPDLPVNVNVLIEGDEEAGSHITDLIMQRPDLVQSDAFIIADSGNQAVGRPAITTGLRGETSCKLTVRTLDIPLHSGLFGGAAPDALIALSRMIATLHDDEGNVAIKGLHEFEWTTGSVEEEDFRRDAGMLPGTTTIGSGSLHSRLWSKPSVSVIGIDAPRIAGASNALVAEASARISLRVAPGADSGDHYKKLVEHLESVVPWGASIEITQLSQGPSFMVDESDDGLEAAQEAMSKAFGAETELLGSGGSIPLVAAVKEMAPQTTVILYGAEDGEKARIHGPNESVDPKEIERLVVTEALYLQSLGS